MMKGNLVIDYQLTDTEAIYALLCGNTILRDEEDEPFTAEGLADKLGLYEDDQPDALRELAALLNLCWDALEKNPGDDEETMELCKQAFEILMGDYPGIDEYITLIYLAYEPSELEMRKYDEMQNYIRDYGDFERLVASNYSSYKRDKKLNQLGL